LLLESVSNENAELMSRERIVRQQHVNLESFEGKTSGTYDAQDRTQVVLILIIVLLSFAMRDIDRYKLQSRFKILSLFVIISDVDNNDQFCHN